MGIFGGKRQESFEEQQLGDLKDDIFGHVDELNSKITGLKYQGIAKDNTIRELEAAREIDTVTMDSNRSTLDFQWKAIDRLTFAQGDFGDYVVGLVMRAQRSPEVEISAYERAHRLAETWVRRDIEALKVREKRDEAERDMRQWLDDGGREQLDAEITAQFESDGTFDTVRTEVKETIHKERETALNQEVIDAATTEANSPEAIAAQRATIVAELEDEGVLSRIRKKAGRERAKTVSRDIMVDTEREATEEFAAKSDEIRASLEADPQMVARRKAATKAKIRELTNLSAEEFMAATETDDPELQAYIQERALATQHQKLFAARHRELKRTLAETKSLDLSTLPDGMVIALEGTLPEFKSTRAGVLVESRDGEFLINKTRVAGDNADTKPNVIERVYGGNFAKLNDRMALIGRTITKRSGETEWSSEVKIGSTVTIRSDENGEGDMQLELRMIKFPSASEGSL